MSRNCVGPNNAGAGGPHLKTLTLHVWLQLWEGQPTKPLTGARLRANSLTLLDLSVIFQGFFSLAELLDCLTLKCFRNSIAQKEACCLRVRRCSSSLLEQHVNDKIDTIPTINASESVDSKTALTSHAEIAPTETTSVPPPPNPFAKPDAGYTGIPVPAPVEYEYLVDSFQWNYGDTQDLDLHQTEFPKALYTVPNIVAKLAEWRLQASDIKIKVKMTGTPFIFGQVGVLFIPRISLAGPPSSYYANRMQVMSSADQHWLTPGVSENVEFLIPRMPLTTFDKIGSDFSIGTLFFNNNVPLRQSGSASEPSPVDITIYASFANTELAGLGETDSPLSLIHKLVKAVQNRKDKNFLRSDPPKKQSGKPKTPVTEAQEKTKGGFISTALSAAGNLAPTLMFTPLAPAAPFAAIGGLLAPFFKAIGLSKPNSVSDNKPVFAGHRRGQAQGSGLAMHERLGLHQDAMLADAKTCGFRSDFDVLELSRRPAWLGTFSWDSTKTAEYVLKVIPLTPSLCYRLPDGDPDVWAPGHMAFYSQFYWKWRGSIRVAFVFVTSTYTTATVRITHNSYNEATTAIEQKGGSRISSVVEIRGYTVFTKTYPYVSYKPWTPVIGFREPTQAPLAADVALDSLEMSVITSARTSDGTGDSSIYCRMFVAGGPDLDYKDFIGFNLRPAQNELPLPPSKQSLAKLFATDFEPLHPALAAREYGYVRNERETNILELCHKECYADQSAILDWPSNPFITQDTNISMLLKPFHSHRGSINYRFALHDVSRVGLDYTSGSWPYGHSSWMTGKTNLLKPTNYVRSEILASERQDICVNLPWTEDVVGMPFAPEAPEDTADETVYFDSTLFPSTVACFMALGDDFQLAGVLQPPLFTIADPAVLRRRRANFALEEEFLSLSESSSSPPQPNPLKLSTGAERSTSEPISSVPKRDNDLKNKIKALFAKGNSD